MNYFQLSYFERFSTFNRDQAQICNINDLKARALQREVLVCKNAIEHRDCEIGMGKDFTQINAISKRKKKGLPDWRQIKGLSNSLMSFTKIHRQNKPFKIASFFMCAVLIKQTRNDNLVEEYTATLTALLGQGQP